MGNGTVQHFLLRTGQALQEITWTDAVGLSVLLALYLAVRLGLGFLARKGRVPLSLARTTTWIFLLLLLELFESLPTVLAHHSLFYPALLVLKIIGWWFVLRNLLDGLYVGVYRSRLRKRPVNQYFMDLFKFGLLLVLSLGAAAAIFDLDMSSILTSSVIVTAVIGFSIQDTISSFISGLLIQVEKPFVAGEWISMGQFTGKVVEITWRYTKIQTIERNTVLIPNNVISRDNVVNYYNPIPQVRQEVGVPVPLDVPPVKARAALRELLKDCPLVTHSPPPAVRCDDILQDRMVLTMIFYVRRYEDIRPARDEVLSGAWYYFHKHGIDFPYPVRQLRRVPKPTAPPGPDVRDMLKKIPYLEVLSPDQLDLLIAVASKNSFEPGTPLVRQGGTGNSMSIILEGEVIVRRDGKEMAILAEGNFFGETALLTGEPRNADVVALTPVRCLEIDREAFKLVLEKNQQVIDVIQSIFEARTKTEDGNRELDKDTFLNRFKKLFL